MGDGGVSIYCTHPNAFFPSMSLTSGSTNATLETELDYLNVHPEYQRKGLGGRLMEWGEEEFTKRDVPSVIAATEAGFGLYLKHGYEERQRYYVDLGKFGGEGRYFNAVLTKFPS